MTQAQLVILGLSLFTAIAAVIDLRTGHIPNRLVLGGFVLAVLFSVTLELALGGSDGALLGGVGRALGRIALGAIACSVVPLILFRLGAMGGGDVKLLAVIGAAAGPLLGLEIELTAFVLIALYAPARLAYQGKLMRLLGNSAALVVNPFLPAPKKRAVPQELMTSLPFGPAVFAASALSLAATWWPT